MLNPPALRLAGRTQGRRHHRIDRAQRHAAGAPARSPASRAASELPPAIGGAKLRSAALAGDAAAEYEVAVRFAEGRGVPANLKQAAHWFERAAAKGLAPAQFRYASMLEKGQGVKKDLGRRPPALSRRRRQRQRQGHA